MLRYEIVEAGPFHTVSKITYEASSGDRAITFHKWPIRIEPCRLYRFQGDGWKTVPDDPNICVYFPNPDDSESEDSGWNVNVGENDDFISVQPGNSWVQKLSHHPPKDVKPGEKFKFVFKGTTLDWWD